MTRHCVLFVLTMLCCLDLWGQAAEHRCFAHLHAGLTVGTTGLGAEVSTPLGQGLELRAGAAIMPYFKETTTMEVRLKGEPTVPAYDNSGYRKDRMGKVQEMMSSFLGYEMQDEVGLYWQATQWNAKVLMDWYPTQARTWYVTAGLYMGPERIATLSSPTDAAHTLMGMSVYNGMYDKIMEGKPILDIGGVTVGFPTSLAQKVRDYGRIDVPVGSNADGSSYSLYPDEHGMLAATVRAGSWLRPYVGGGYRGWLDRSHRTALAIEAGCMLWGGRPSILLDNGDDLARKDLNLDGALNRWVHMYRWMTVYPVLELRITRRLF